MNTFEIQKQRKELILAIIEMHNFFMLEWYRAKKGTISRDLLWNKELVDINFNRFHIVETTTHNEENFSVKLEVRYALRSQEAYAYGNGHDAYYKRYLATVSFSIEDITNPEEWKKQYKKDLDEAYNKPKTEKV